MWRCGIKSSSPRATWRSPRSSSRSAANCAADLASGTPHWTTETGLVVRGYISKIDNTVQPYGLVVPESYDLEGKDKYRLDLWFHGRGETLSEVSFINQRLKQVGQYAPRDTFVLHPYGRYSNAFKFAGEVDVLEALDHARSEYRIDPDHISVRGFSMGGAACWQFAVHYADRWFAANPGAGFAETPEFLRIFQKETLHPADYEKKLWKLYDCDGYAINLFQCPTVAYSGELDTQKQAADLMQQALKKEGIELTHIIGPGTKHAIHPESKIIIERLMDSIAERGRGRMPRTIHFATYTLKYNRMFWVTVDALGEHWSQARVDANLQGADHVQLKTHNVMRLTLSMPAGWCPLDILRQPRVTIDGQSLTAPQPTSDRSWRCELEKAADGWRVAEDADTTLRKRHDLQGPIDDAFMDSFIIVKPSGKAWRQNVAKWSQSEADHAIEHWRRQFRGSARVKHDTEIDANDIASANLVLFGDPSSNSVLKKVADKLPIRWTRDAIVVGSRRFDAQRNALVMIYPNPLNPRRYIVLNSGFTYREYDYLNNARQVPKLPDWAVIDITAPADSRGPGKVVAADFFGEKWELQTGKD